MSIHILHLANDYQGSRVYSQLVKAIDKLNIKQTVFTQVRHQKDIGVNSIVFQTENSKILYGLNWRPWHRVAFHFKVQSNYQELLKHLPIDNVSHVHAHTLFSDGALALKLRKDFGIPYTVTIRNTDINVYMRFMFHTWSLGVEVMKHAERIVCISPAHAKRACRWSFCPSGVKEKLVNIPNGVDSFWLEHIQTEIHKPLGNHTWHLLYMGNFTPNKNLPRLMNAVTRLNDRGYKLQLHIIGDCGADTLRIEKMAGSYPTVFHLYGRIQDKGRILEIMRKCHLFAMPSLHETFGLVYVEALSQGLPILYTRGEGVDGFFSSSYGVACNPRSISDIASSIEYLITDYANFRVDSCFLSAHFDWDKVALKYLELIDSSK